MFEALANYLIKNGDFGPEELKLVEAAVKPKRLRKRQYFLQEGDINHYNGFVVKGCLRLFRVAEDGTEHIMRFFIEDWWATDYMSFHGEQRSNFYIEALEDCELLVMDKKSFDELVNTIPKMRKMIEKLSAKNYEATQNRILSNISETAEQRYANFANGCPQIFNRVPLHMVASFLGLSRETLSRVRKQYIKKRANEGPKQALNISL